MLHQLKKGKAIGMNWYERNEREYKNYLTTCFDKGTYCQRFKSGRSRTHSYVEIRKYTELEKTKIQRR